MPGAGRLLSGALVRTVLHPVPVLLGSVNGPVNVAPACSVITSPGCAALSAACRSPPAETVIVVPVGATSVVSRKTRGGSGATAHACPTTSVNTTASTQGTTRAALRGTSNDGRIIWQSSLHGAVTQLPRRSDSAAQCPARTSIAREKDGNPAVR